MPLFSLHTLEIVFAISKYKCIYLYKTRQSNVNQKGKLVSINRKHGNLRFNCITGMASWNYFICIFNLFVSSTFNYFLLIIGSVLPINAELKSMRIAFQ